jgi:hypothetical protein
VVDDGTKTAIEAFDLLRADLSLLSKVTKTETRPFRTDFILLSHWRKKKLEKLAVT